MNPTYRRCTTALLCSLAVLASSACNPYPDDGEFFAGYVFARNFVAGVKRLSTAAPPPAANPVPPRAQNDDRQNAYSLLFDSGTSATPTPTAAAPASSPLWSNLYGPKVTRPDGSTVPLHVDTAQQVYVFDGPCQPPQDYSFDERIDPYRQDRQFPVFSDLPELLAANSGRPGRLSPGSYSAIVQVVHVQIPNGFPCQSVKRFKTVSDRTAVVNPEDIQLAASSTKEYRLLLLFDPTLTTPPLPTQIGWFDQLIVPYIDMGPVPVDPVTSTFKTMPIVRFTNPGNPAVVMAAPDETDRLRSAPYAYSPLCRSVSVTLAAGQPAIFDLNLYKAQIDAPPANPRANLSACLVCYTQSDGGYACPFAQSGAGSR